jgi:hypothetical protein
MLGIVLIPVRVNGESPSQYVLELPDLNDECDLARQAFRCHGFLHIPE